MFYNLIDFKVLLPAIVLHGLFDFLLFVMGAIQFAYQIDALWLDVLQLVVPLLVTVCGIIYAKNSFDKVLQQCV
jgi:hypothetical protein